MTSVCGATAASAGTVGRVVRALAMVSVVLLSVAGCAGMAGSGANGSSDSADWAATTTAPQMPAGVAAARQVLGPDAQELVGRDSIVVGTAPLTRLAAYLQLAEEAVGDVPLLWGERLSLPVVLVAPATTSEFVALTGHSGTEDQVAAVTVGSGRKARVTVHPHAPDRLRPEGVRAIVRHELAHLAMRGRATENVPMWLTEGLAEYTAYRQSGLTAETVAGAVLQEVRAGAGPDRLPANGDLDPSRSSIADAYATSWLVCLFIADRWSEQALVQLYDVAAEADSMASALWEVLGVSESELTRGWLSWLDELAGSQA